MFPRRFHNARSAHGRGPSARTSNPHLCDSQTVAPVTIELGTNTLLGAKPERIAEIPGLLSDATPATAIPLWDGHAGERAPKRF